MIQFFFLFWLFTTSLYAVDPFVVVTAERTGTHLLTKALTLLTKKPVSYLWDRTAPECIIDEHLDTVEAEGHFFHMHAWPHAHIVDCFQKKGYKVIFLLRDPRDHLVAVLNYIRIAGWEYENLRMDYPFGKLSTQEQLTEMITGEKYGVCIPKEFIWQRLPWMIADNAYTARFENLVGVKGGGTRNAQIKELANLASFLHIPVSKEEIEAIADNLFGGDGHWNGQIGSWRIHFTKAQKALFKKHFGHQLIVLGYETSLDW